MSNFFPNWIFELQKLFFLKAAPDQLKIPRTVKTYCSQIAYEKDINNIIEITDYEPKIHYQKLYRDYLRCGNLCHLLTGKSNDEIVGYVWSFKDQYKLSTLQENIFAIFQNQDVFFADGYISPKYRLRGGFPLLLKSAADDNLKKYKIKNIFASTNAMNEHSLKSHKRLGFNDFCTLYYITVLGFQLIIILYKNKTKRLRISLKNFKTEVPIY